jgi:hypothetical protein
LLLPFGHALSHLEAMLRARNFALVFLALASPAVAQLQQSLGIFGSWGAFREKGRCYAIAKPQSGTREREGRAFASIGYWPDRRARGQVYFRLSQAKRPASALLLRIDDRTFELSGDGDNAWAPDARADAEIVAAMRAGLEMSVQTRSPSGAMVRDSYGLRGAATAVDAAAVGCARR